MNDNNSIEDAIGQVELSKIRLLKRFLTQNKMRIYSSGQSNSGILISFGSGNYVTVQPNNMGSWWTIEKTIKKDVR
jgi:hypothetical protein